MPFVKGQSGNPAGRTSRQSREQAQFTRWCQLAVKKYGWKSLEKFLLSSDKDDQKWALDRILDRGFGKALQLQQNENYDMTQDIASSQLETERKKLEESIAAAIKSTSTITANPSPGNARSLGGNSNTPSLPA